MPPPKFPILDALSSAIDGIQLDATKEDAPSYLTGIDNAFLAGETENHLLSTAGIYIFEKRMDEAKVRQQVEAYAMGAHPRMRMKVVRNEWTFGRPYYAPTTFDVDRHFVVNDVPAPGTDADIQELAGRLVTVPVDWDVPPWRVHYLRLPEGQDRTVFLWIAHHCLADGQGFARTLIAYCASLDPVTGEPVKEPIDVSKFQYSAGREAKKAPPKTSANIADELYDLGERFLKWILGVWLWAINMTLLAFVLKKRSMAEPDLYPQKQVSYSKKFLMADVRRAKDAYKCTINDLLVTATSGAVQKYLETKRSLKDRELVYMIPTSVRKQGDNSMSNEVSSWLVPIPAIYSNPVERLDMVAQRFKIYKKSEEPYIGYNIGQRTLVFPWLFPKVDTNQMNPLHGVITNVPGPNKPIYWGGVPFARYIGLVCVSANMIGCCLCSYEDHVSLGIMLTLNPDAEKHQLFAKGDAQLIAHLFEAEMNSLLKATYSGATRRVSLVESLVPKTEKDDEGIGKDEEDTELFIKGGRVKAVAAREPERAAERALGRLAAGQFGTTSVTPTAA